MLKKEIKPIIQKLLLGFAAGVMIAASVWSLLIPAIEMAETQGKPAWLPASVGFMIGIVTLIGVNNLAEKIEKRNNKKNECVICDDIENLLDAEENDEKIVIKNKEKLTIKEKVKSTTMLMLAVTLHNIPEGMAVGVAFGRTILTKYRNNTRRSICISYWNSDTKYTRRGNYINATS